MPRDRNVRERRQEAIVEILSARELVREQKDLVEKLKARGFEATQSSISRDLRDLGIIRINGYYDLPLQLDTSEGITRKMDEYVQAASAVGPNMTLLHVMHGSSVLVSRLLTEANWPEVSATLASLDDKVLVFTSGLAGQQRLFQRMKSFMYALS